jgi:hypothetical protein
MNGLQSVLALTLTLTLTLTRNAMLCDAKASGLAARIADDAGDDRAAQPLPRMKPPTAPNGADGTSPGDDDDDDEDDDAVGGGGSIDPDDDEGVDDDDDEDDEEPLRCAPPAGVRLNSHWGAGREPAA